VSGSLGSAAISRARVQVPAWGRPWIDVELVTADVFAKGARPALVVADVPIVATVVDGGAHEGRAAYRLACGQGGWGQTIPRKSYANDAGVKVASVLQDAAAACGETLAGPLPSTRLGPHYARAEGPASEVLNGLAPRGWYVDLDGTTRIGQRPATAYTGAAPRTRVDPSVGIVELATETLSGLVPGVVVDELAPATDVEYLLEPGRLTARVWGGAGYASRMLDALSRIVEALTARTRYHGKYEFRVVTQSGERLNLQPVRVANGLGDLTNVPVRPGVPGTRSNVQLGSLVLVEFVDRDPSRPVVTNFDAPDSPGWMPLTIELGGPGALGVARITDTVQAGAFAGVITGCSARVKAVL
jgi:hypothetical protein